MQVVLQALVAEVQATEEFLIPPQLHAGISSGVHLEVTRLLAACAICYHIVQAALQATNYKLTSMS
jgi:hypothetical protein